MNRSPKRHPSEHSDPELLASIAEGDLSCLGILFDRYAVDVGRFIVRLGAEHDVDDLVQATFLLVPRAASGFRGGAVRAWLFGLAANLLRRHRRTLLRMAARIAAWGRERKHDTPATPGESFEVREGAIRTMSVLGQLSEKKREAFVMVIMEGLSVDEVAVALGVPVGTVWTRLHHARRELRAHLAKSRP